MATVLTIAGSDSGGGAGIQADLKTFAALGAYGTSAVTALTAQNTVEVAGVHLVPAPFVVAQIDAVARDIAVAAVKTGMLGTAAIVAEVAAAIERWAFPRIVVDPVMVATSGGRLLDAEAIDTMRRELVPLASLVTPNRLEAEVLTGHEVRTRRQAQDAARRLVDLGAAAVVVKGGHFDEPDVVDLLYDGADFREFRHARLKTRHTHGSGCTLAAGVAAGLARGLPLGDAVDQAIEYVAGAIAHGLDIGSGRGPLDHFWRLGDRR
jgi:hydroxymethylpyrimidine/phosphomethylpyrimidine kinase